MLLQQLKDFKDFFYGTLVKCNIDLVDIEPKPDANPSSSRCYPDPHINKETFRKELTHLVYIGVLTPVQQSEYGKPVFIIVKKERTVKFLTNFC